MRKRVKILVSLKQYDDAEDIQAKANVKEQEEWDAQENVLIDVLEKHEERLWER